MATNQNAADALFDVKRGIRDAANAPSGDTNYKQKVDLGRSGRPFVANTQDESSAANSGARRTERNPT